jgi:hypothetical protein
MESPLKKNRVIMYQSNLKQVKQGLKEETGAHVACVNDEKFDA